MMNNYRIDYYTATMDFEPQNNGRYHWKKLRYFRKGNIILIRNSKVGRDTIIQLIDDPRPMNEEDKKLAERWGNQKYVCFYQILYHDSESYPEKKRNLPKKLKLEILERCDHRCTICGNKFPEENLEIDHIKEFSQQGFTMSNNLQPLCKRHHKIKTLEFRGASQDILSKIKNSPNVI